MKNKLNPIIQTLALLIVPVLVILLFKFIMAITGKDTDISLISSTLKTSLFVIPNVLYIILHKYRLSYLSFIVAGIATFLVVYTSDSNQIDILSTFSLYLFNFIYFTLLIGVTYFSYFKVQGFKLKNILFILGGIITHTLSFSGIFLMNKQSVNIDLLKAITYTGINTFLMVGLAIAIGLLFFELPEKEVEAEYDNDDDL